MRTTGVESYATRLCNVYNSTVRLAQLKKVELFNRATISLEKINEVIPMKILACLVMLGTYYLGTYSDVEKNHYDMDSGLIVVENGDARIDNQQYYVGQFGEPR